MTTEKKTAFPRIALEIQNKDLHKRLRYWAVAQEKKISELVRDLLEEHVPSWNELHAMTQEADTPAAPKATPTAKPKTTKPSVQSKQDLAFDEAVWSFADAKGLKFVDLLRLTNEHKDEPIGKNNFEQWHRKANGSKGIPAKHHDAIKQALEPYGFVYNQGE